MKNAYSINDLVDPQSPTYIGKSRSTLYRMMKRDEFPEPDIKTGHPRWFRSTISAYLPNLTTSPSA